MPNPDDFNPNSINATLSRIMSAQDELHRKADRIIAQIDLTNGRVKKLEIWKAVVNSQTAMVASIVAGIVAVIGSVISYLAKR
jgi:hypothetical protein